MHFYDDSVSVERAEKAEDELRHWVCQSTEDGGGCKFAVQSDLVARMYEFPHLRSRQ